jgi:uncharacterized membrane protein
MGMGQVSTSPKPKATTSTKSDNKQLYGTITFIIGLLVFFVIFMPIAQQLDSGGGGGGGGGGDGGSGNGYLSISDGDRGLIYVNGQYVGQTSAYLTLAPGGYSVVCYSPSSGDVCWERSTTVYSGKTSQIHISGNWCR